MKDYADKSYLAVEPMSDLEIRNQRERSRSINYLMDKGIWRGKASCNHVYTNSEGRRVTPILRFERGDGLPF